MKIFKTATVCVLIGLAGSVLAEPQAQTIRSYHIGNSLTFGAAPGMKAVLQSRGAKAECGWSVLWGQSLGANWDKAGQPSNTSPDGSFTNALTQKTWDVLTLQSWGAAFEGEVVMARKFIELAMRKSPDIQVFIYETWPFNNKGDTRTFADKWTRSFPKPGEWDSVWNATYCKELVKRLNKEMPGLKKPVRLIPAGSVMAEVDTQIRDGKVTDLTKIEDLYKDNIHLNAAGNCMVRWTMYAAMTKDSPVGLPIPAEVPEALGKTMQAAAWKVVSESEFTGVK
jgi:hypothetical protein